MCVVNSIRIHQDAVEFYCKGKNFHSFYILMNPLVLEQQDIFSPPAFWWHNGEKKLHKSLRASEVVKNYDSLKKIWSAYNFQFRQSLILQPKVKRSMLRNLDHT